MMTLETWLTRMKEAREKATKGVKHPENAWQYSEGDIYLSDYAYVEIAESVGEADGEFIALAANEWNRLLEIIRVQNEALGYYAAGDENPNRAKEGARLEFGCGCCAGVIEDDSNNHDGDVIGLTAREALARVEALVSGAEKGTK